MSEIADVLLALERDGGRLLPVDVVNAARDPASPLHSHFTWDDKEAAERYRLEQARTLIRSVKVEITVQQVPVRVVGYVRDPSVAARDAGYRNVACLRTEEDSARDAIVAEMRRVADAVTRARTLAMVLGVADALDKIEETARAITARVLQPASAA